MSFASYNLYRRKISAGEYQHSPDIPDYSLVINASPIEPLLVSSEGEITEEIVNKDIIYTKTTFSPAIYGEQFEFINTSTYWGDIVYESLNSGICTITENRTNFISPGTVTIKAIASSLEGKSTTITFNLTQKEKTNSITSTISNIHYAENSFAKDANDIIDSALAGKDASTALKIFTTQNHSSANYVRNINCWAVGFDLTCISPWNSDLAHKKAGVLVAPDIVLFAAHYPISNGSTIRFITQDNQVITKTIIGTKTHPSYKPYYPDIQVALLDSDAPETIKFCKVFPENWKNYGAVCQMEYTPRGTVPTLTTDQEEKALVTDASSLSTLVNLSVPVDSKRLEFYESKITGDSGNPCFIILDGELVLLTMLTYGGAGSGTFITLEIDTINQIISDLGSSYSLTTFDLSIYNSYT